jgi:hypothetical protein
LPDAVPKYSAARRPQPHDRDEEEHRDNLPRREIWPVAARQTLRSEDGTAIGRPAILSGYRDTEDVVTSARGSTRAST